MEFFRDPKIDFLGKRMIFAIVSIVAVTGSIALLATRGLSYGIDFRGGADVVLRFAIDPGVDKVRAALSSEGLAGAQIQNLSSADSINVYDLLIRVPQGTDYRRARMKHYEIGLRRTRTQHADSLPDVNQSAWASNSSFRR